LFQHFADQEGTGFWLTTDGLALGRSSLQKNNRHQEAMHSPSRNTQAMQKLTKASIMHCSP
jgi:hypothetical protein